jgi:hypothetical protein
MLTFTSCLGALDLQDVHESEQSHTGDGVAAVEAIVNRSIQRADKDDPPVAASAHVDESRPCQPVTAEHCGQELGRVGLGEHQLRRGVRAACGLVHHYVEPAETLEGDVDDRLPALG